MGRQLREGVGTVWVRTEDGVTDESTGLNMVSFAEGDDIPKWAAEQMGDHCFEDDADGTDPITGNYADASAKDLKAEIDRRNEGRDDDHQISKSGTKDALIAALTADDEA